MSKVKWSRSWALLTLIATVCVLVYWPGRTGGFVFDDIGNIVANRDVKIESLHWHDLVGAALSTPMDGPGRPVSMLSFGLNHAFAGLNPLPYKLTNIAIHLLTVFIAFFLARGIFESLRLAGRAGPSPDRTILYAAAVAAIFALHPMQLTSVLYVVQRMTSLAGLFTLLGLLGYVTGRRQVFLGQGGLATLILAPASCMVLGLLAKENALLLPVFALAIEMVIFRFRALSGALDRQILAWHTTFVFAPAVIGLAWIALEPERFLAAYAVRDFTLTERLLTEGRVMVTYIKDLFAPSMSELGLYRDDITISQGLFSPASTLPAIAFLAGLFGLAWYVRNRIPLVSLGILWFFAGHLMESTILPLEIAHEHRNYVPLFGFALAMVGIATRVESLRFPRWAPLAALLPFLVLLAFATWLRATQWSNPLEFAESEVRHHPASSRANYEAGRLYTILATQGHNEAAGRAFELLERAASLDPGATTPLASAIIGARRLGKPVPDGWITEVTRRFAEAPFGPASMSALKSLARAVKKDAVLTDTETVAILNAATANPTLGALPRFRADVAAIYAEYLINVRGDVPLAEAKFRAAVAAAPQIGQYRANLVNFLLAIGRPDDAAHEIEALRSLSRGAVSERRLTIMEADVDRLRSHLSTN